MTEDLWILIFVMVAKTPLVDANFARFTIGFVDSKVSSTVLVA